MLAHANGAGPRHREKSVLLVHPTTWHRVVGYAVTTHVVGIATCEESSNGTLLRRKVWRRLEDEPPVTASSQL